MAYTSINKPSDYFNTVLYTGTGTSPLSVTGVEFQPDFLWIKRRESSGNHRLTDIVRGVANHLESSNTDAEKSSSGIGSFDSDGWTFNSTGVSFNTSGGTYVGWNWLAGGTGVSNTDGSITSTVSANTTSGFSIVSYTGNGTSGATIGHGLGVAPSMIITKQRNSAGNWFVYHKSLPVTEYIILSSTVASQTDNEIIYNDTTPSSTTFTVGNYSQINGSSNTFISYCFAEKKGFSKFGSYTGNGSAGNGPFVYTGFKPAWILIRWTGGTEIWQVWDSKRDTYNVQQRVLAPNSTNAEDTNGSGGYLLIDSLSNGFKVRGNPVGNAINGSGQNYIYMAFAESPFTTSTGIPTTAR